MAIQPKSSGINRRANTKLDRKLIIIVPKRPTLLHKMPDMVFSFSESAISTYNSLLDILDGDNLFLEEAFYRPGVFA